MKLYATTTSERASKGQGGNKYLNIDILDEEENLIAYISVLSYNDKPTIKIYYDIDLIEKPEMIGEYLSKAINIKGKKQKTAKCSECGNGLDEVGGCRYC